MAALQGLTVEPQESPAGSYKVALMVCVGDGQFAWKDFQAADLAVVMDCLTLFTLDPENWMKTYLGYEAPESAKGFRRHKQPDYPEPSVTYATIEDLDL